MTKISLLGSHSANYTPTNRGFASHVGYWTGQWHILSLLNHKIKDPGIIAVVKYPCKLNDSEFLDQNTSLDLPFDYWVSTDI